MQIIEVDVNELKPAEYNPRTSSDKENQDLKNSIQRFGLVDPIIVNGAENRRNIVIGGHFRLRIAKELGISRVPVVYVDLSDIAREKELNLRLNKNLGQFDFDLLANFEEDLLKDVGFDSTELDKIFQLDAKPEDDDIPENAPAVAKLGDIWQLGRHRVMCGDSTKREDVERLMDGNKADMVFTSPPYNIGKNAGLRQGLDRNKDKKYNLYIDYWDDKTNQDWIDLVKNSINAWREHSQYQVYDMQILAGNKVAFFELMNELKNYVADVMIWDKNHGAPCPAKNVMTCQFEFIMFFSSELNPNRSIKTASFQGNLSNVYRGEPQRNNEYADIHGATFPVHLPEFIINNFTTRESVVADNFAGTGTTLIACEKLNRKCRMMEIDPKYCDTIIKRWEDYTGQKAVKING